MCSHSKIDICIESPNILAQVVELFDVFMELANQSTQKRHNNDIEAATLTKRTENEAPQQTKLNRFSMKRALWWVRHSVTLSEHWAPSTLYTLRLDIGKSKFVKETKKNRRQNDKKSAPKSYFYWRYTLFIQSSRFMQSKQSFWFEGPSTPKEFIKIIRRL